MFYLWILIGKQSNIYLQTQSITINVEIGDIIIWRRYSSYIAAISDKVEHLDDLLNLIINRLNCRY